MSAISAHWFWHEQYCSWVKVRDCSKLTTLFVMELKKNGPRRRQTGVRPRQHGKLLLKKWASIECTWGPMISLKESSFMQWMSEWVTWYRWPSSVRRVQKSSKRFKTGNHETLPGFWNANNFQLSPKNPTKSKKKNKYLQIRSWFSVWCRRRPTVAPVLLSKGGKYRDPMWLKAYLKRKMFSIDAGYNHSSLSD